VNRRGFLASLLGLVGCSVLPGSKEPQSKVEERPTVDKPLTQADLQKLWGQMLDQAGEQDLWHPIDLKVPPVNTKINPAYLTAAHVMVFSHEPYSELSFL
jgi:hypothetical protein